MQKIRRSVYFFIFFLFTVHVWGQNLQREFRGMWVTTVNNLDWPSTANLDIEGQKTEILSMLDTLYILNFNAVIFQIRPTADAFYKSETEPWSAYLTGKQGVAHENEWDPLQFMIDESHKRGFELHAWLNPFRVQQKISDPLSLSNIANRNPEWILTYGNKTYIDPGIPEVKEYINGVVAEIVRNYDIDAIHFDDYFYPYPIANIPFPDTLSFKKYNNGFDISQIDEWRRSNVDSIISSLNRTIKNLKPWVKFGISPFGVWKNFETDPKGSVTRAGATNFDHLYADVISWQQKGWIDYLMPQIYWEIGHPTADFVTLANWWNEHSFSKHVYIGHALYKMVDNNDEAWKSNKEMPEQIYISRQLKNISGSAFFRMKYLDKNPNGFKEQLYTDLYKQKALIPVMTWIDSIAPIAPQKIIVPGLFRKKRIEFVYSNKHQKEDDTRGFLLFHTQTNRFVNEEFLMFTTKDVLPIDELKLKKEGNYYLWVMAIDKLHNTSLPTGPTLIKIK
jgi:uncharacterized lipoprotein YddW (UPF0748 family)